MPIKGGSSGGASTGGIRAGAAFVEMWLKDNMLVRGLDALRKRLQSFGAFMSKVGGGLAAGGSALLTPLTGLLTAAVDHGADVKRLSEQLGTTADKLTELSYAANTVGIPMEQFADVAKDFQDKLSKAAHEGGEAAKAFDVLGLNAAQLLDLPLDEQLARVGTALDNMADPADRTALSLAVLGGQGNKLAPALKNLQALSAEAREVGAVMSDETAGKAQEASRAFSKAWASIKYAVLEVGLALIPSADVMKGLVSSIVSLARGAREWIQSNQEGIKTAVALTAAVVALGASLYVVGAAAQFLLTPYGLIIAAVAGLTYLFVTQTETGAQWADAIMGAFGEVAAFIGKTWGGISDAITAGRLDLAAMIGFAALKVAWAQLVVYMTDAWNSFKGFFVDGWHDAVHLVALAMNDLATGLKIAWEKVTSKILSLFAGMIRHLLSLGATIAGAVGLDELEESLNTLDKGLADFDRSRQQSSNRAVGRLRAQNEAIAKILNDDANREQRKRDKARAADAAGARSDLSAARAELDRLREEAAYAAAAARGGKLETSPIDRAGLPTQRQLAESVRGAFQVARGAGQFAIGDKLAEKQLEATEKVAANTDIIAKAVAGADATAAVGGLVFR